MQTWTTSNCLAIETTRLLQRCKVTVRQERAYENTDVRNTADDNHNFTSEFNVPEVENSAVLSPPKPCSASKQRCVMFINITPFNLRIQYLRILHDRIHTCTHNCNIHQSRTLAHPFCAVSARSFLWLSTFRARRDVTWSPWIVWPRNEQSEGRRRCFVLSALW